jgi:hypothetical protein
MSGSPSGQARPDSWHNVTLAEGSEAGAPEDTDIADVNGDGLPDIIVSAELAHLIYFQNPGAGARTKRWERLILPQTLGRGSFIRVFFADLDGDKHPEAVTANKGEQNPDPNTSRPTSISAFRVNGDPLKAESWKEQELGRYLVPQNAHPVDIDSDGDIDIIGGVRVGPRIVLLRNDRAGRFEEIAITPSEAAFGGFQLRFRRYERGWPRRYCQRHQRPGVVFTDGLAWLEQPRDLSQPWITHRIGTFGPDWMVGIALADIDGDGDTDVLSGGIFGRRARSRRAPAGGKRDGPVGMVREPGRPCGRLDAPRHLAPRAGHVRQVHRPGP